MIALKKSSWCLLFVSLFIFGSCMSYSTLQTAQTVPPGKVQYGGGVAILTNDGGTGVLPELGARIGLAKRFDVGLKYSLPALFAADMKYQFLDSGLDASFDMGWSYYSHNDIGLHGFYPMLIMGQEHWYLGVKGAYFSSSGRLELFGEALPFNGSGYFGTSLVTGGMIGGETVKLLLELNTYIMENHSPFFVPAAGLYFEF